MGTFRTVVGTAEKIATSIAVILMLVMMLVVCSDVFMRYVAGRPLRWAYDFVSLYVTVGVFFLALSASCRENAHIGVDILISRLPPRARAVSALAGNLVGMGLFGLIFWFGLQRAWDSVVEHEVLDGLILWPTWPSNMVVPVGMALLECRLAISAADNIKRMAGRMPMEDLSHAAIRSIE